MNHEDQQIIINLAYQAGELARRHAGALTIEDKADGSLVTNADREVEELIRSQLATRWPDDAIVGEEMPSSADIGTGDVWYIDPIDGTHNFIGGLPLWAVCIGRCCDGLPTAGVIHAPALDLTWTAFRDQGAYLNGTALQVTDCQQLVRSHTVAFTTEAAAELHLDLPYSQRNLGSAALHCGYLTTGAFKACVFSNWWIWDMVPGLAIAREAGVVACDLRGEELNSLARFDARERNEPLVLAPPSVASLVAQNTSYTPRPAQG